MLVSDSDFLASGKSIVRTREMIFPLLSRKGFAIARILYHKFTAEQTFTTKLVVLYLINDLLAVCKANLPGFIPCLEPYIEIMISTIRTYPDCSTNRLSSLIELWSQHNMYSYFFINSIMI